jgi:hypothetical protein
MIAVRAGTRRAVHAARAAGPTGAMVLGALALGYGQSKGWLNKLPTVGGSRSLTIGLAGYAVTRLVRNPTARMVGTVAVIVGAFDYGRIQGGGKSSLEGDVEGDVDGDVDGDDGY